MDDADPDADGSWSDAEVDVAFKSAKNGGGWLIGSSVVAFVGGMVSGVPMLGAIGFGIGLVLFVAGMAVRRRRWRAFREQVGDDAAQRAGWRYADAERDRSAGVGATVGWLLLGAALLVYQLSR